MESLKPANEQDKSWFKLDPRTKLLIMVMITTVMFKYSVTISLIGLAMIPFILLVSNRQLTLGAVYMILFAAAICVRDIQAAFQLGTLLNAVLVLLSGLVLRLFPIFMMGAYIMSSTTVSEFIASMERMNVSKHFIIPLCVMFRFLPTVREESACIKDAMRMRNIQFGTKRIFANPVSLLEYRFVPLMTSVVKIGDELSAAALTRGLGSPARRTSIAKIGFGRADGIFLLAALTAFIGLFL